MVFGVVIVLFKFIMWFLFMWVYVCGVIFVGGDFSSCFVFVGFGVFLVGLFLCGIS